jgi:hypothetical protein
LGKFAAPALMTHYSTADWLASTVANVGLEFLLQQEHHLVCFFSKSLEPFEK